MADIPTRQKILLIVLAISLAYLGYTFLLDDTGTVSTPVPARVVPTGTPPQQAIIQQQPVSRRQPAFRVSAGTQSEKKSQAAINLQLKDDPFFRKPKPKIVSTDSQPEVDRLVNLKFNGSAEGKLALINNEFYEIGDVVNGLQIIAIRIDRVILLDRDGTTYILR